MCCFDQEEQNEGQGAEDHPDKNGQKASHSGRWGCVWGCSLRPLAHKVRGCVSKEERGA